MIIVVDNNLLVTDSSSTSFIYECFKRITTQHTEHQFIFISNKAFDTSLIFSKNVTTVIISSKTKHTIIGKFWYNRKIATILKKYKADVLVTSESITASQTKVPQCLILQDLTFLTHPIFVEKKLLTSYKKNVPLFLKISKRVIVFSEYAKENIIEKYKIDNNKIDIIPNGINNHFKAIEWQERETIKEKYANGKEYFLYSGAINPIKNLILLLKAFSFFKKRQKSNMLLLIIDRTGNPDDLFINSLKTYKYREDVKILSNLSEIEVVKVTAAAYTFVSPSFFENFPTEAIEAMQSKVPVVVSNINSITKTLADSALYANVESFEDIADKMMLLFKDEDKRNQLIAQGYEHSKQYNWDKTANLIWQSILKATRV